MQATRTLNDCRALLDQIRPAILALPVDHKHRKSYRSLRRGLANAAEEARFGGNTNLLSNEGAQRHYENCAALAARLKKGD